MVRRDRGARTRARVAGRGQVTVHGLDDVFGSHLEATTLCTDAAQAYKRFAAKHNIDHQVLNQHQGQRKRSIYHLSHVNACHSRLKTWIRQFNGVSTKYLQNYLVWFLYEDRSASLTQDAQVLSLLLATFEQPVRLRATTDGTLAA